MTIMKVQTEEPKRYIYYKASGLENINELAKKYLGDEKFSEVIKGLNPGKIDADGKILKDAEILIPYNP